MFLQGDLQVVFDALYNLGVIDPVLEEDWEHVMSEMPNHYKEYELAMKVINDNQSNFSVLIGELEQFNERVLSFIAMEVAKEFADFHSREELH